MDDNYYFWRKEPSAPTASEAVFCAAMADIGADEEDAVELYRECVNRLFGAEPTLRGLEAMTYDEWRIVLSPAAARVAAGIRDRAILRTAAAERERDILARNRLLDRAKALADNGLDGAAKRLFEQAVR